MSPLQVAQQSGRQLMVGKPCCTCYRQAPLAQQAMLLSGPTPTHCTIHQLAHSHHRSRPSSAHSSASAT